MFCHLTTIIAIKFLAFADKNSCTLVIIQYIVGFSLGFGKMQNCLLDFPELLTTCTYKHMFVRLKLLCFTARSIQIVWSFVHKVHKFQVIEATFHVSFNKLTTILTNTH